MTYCAIPLACAPDDATGSYCRRGGTPLRSCTAAVRLPASPFSMKPRVVTAMVDVGVDGRAAVWCRNRRITVLSET
jgi:hypothetical protein